MSYFLLATKRQENIIKEIFEKDYKDYGLVLPDSDFDYFQQSHIVNLLSSTNIQNIIITINNRNIDLVEPLIINQFKFYSKLNRKKVYEIETEVKLINEYEFDNQFIIDVLKHFNSINTENILKDFFVPISSYQSVIKGIIKDKEVKFKSEYVNLSLLLKTADLSFELLEQYLETKESNYNIPSYLQSVLVNGSSWVHTQKIEPNWLNAYLLKYFNYIKNIVTSDKKWVNY